MLPDPYFTWGAGHETRSCCSSGAKILAAGRSLESVVTGGGGGGGYIKPLFVDCYSALSPLFVNAHAQMIVSARSHLRMLL